jgi:transposase
MPLNLPISSVATSKSRRPVFVLPSELPTDVTELTALLYAQQAAHETELNRAIAAIEREAQEKIQHLIEQMIQARHRMFGISSEQLTAQGRLFDEAETLAADTTEVDDVAAIPATEESPTDTSSKKTSKATRGKRSPLPAELKRIDIVHDVPEQKRTCPCGTPMIIIGEEISEQLDIIPMQVQVLRHIRKRYGCPGSLHAPVTAALPPQPIPKSNASADLLAMLLAVKFIDGMPLARFEIVLERHGIRIPRQTLARWVIGAGKLLQPLLNLIRDSLLEGPFIHMDETVLQVLKEPDKPPTSNSYMWVQTGGLPDKPVVLFDYDPSRSGNVPVSLLQDYRGYLMTDGYEGYAKVARTDGIEHLICWAHVRRRFVEAARVQPKGKRGRADEAVRLIGRLYQIERDCKDATDAQRLLMRQQQSISALNALQEWMTKTLPGVAPSSALGKALGYMKKYWSRLTRYTERGELPIDNNPCENAIRPFVVGRKGWLFSDTQAGAHASATIYSLVQTAKANGVEPYSWLRRVLRDLPAAQTPEQIEALLPWNLPELKVKAG